MRRWLVPFIGHMGIASSAGIIYDFAAPYTVNVGGRVSILFIVVVDDYKVRVLLHHRHHDPPHCHAHYDASRCNKTLRHRGLQEDNMAFGRPTK